MTYTSWKKDSVHSDQTQIDLDPREALEEMLLDLLRDLVSPDHPLLLEHPALKTVILSEILQNMITVIVIVVIIVIVIGIAIVLLFRQKSWNVSPDYGKAKPALRAIQEETINLPSEVVNSTSAVLGEQLRTITDEPIIDEPLVSDSDGDSCSIASGDDFTSMSDQGEHSNMMRELPDFDYPQFDMWENECFLDLLFYEPNDVDIYISTHMHYLDDSLRQLHNGSYELFDRVTRETHYTSDEPGVTTNLDYTDSVSNDDLPALTTDWSFIHSDEDPWGFSAPHNGHYPDLSTDIQWLDDFEEEVEDMLIDDQNRKSGRYNKSLFFEKSFKSNRWLEGDHRRDDSEDDAMPSLCIASDSESDCDDFEMDRNHFEDGDYFRGLWELDVPLEKVGAINDASTSKKFVKTHILKSSKPMGRPTRTSRDNRCLSAMINIAGRDAYTLFDSGSTSDALSPAFTRVVAKKSYPLEKSVNVQLGTAGSRSRINFGTTALVSYSSIKEDNEYFDVFNID
ncbi:hypothetical protein C8J56DRAFT_1063063 [Mycena floridula]|nr:hypothetical protein C8J56DRAFT_1063063 [Mycena floridula]